MKLKEIKPDMVINCRTQEEVRALSSRSSLPSHYIGHWSDYGKNTCFRYIGNAATSWVVADVKYYKRAGYKVTPFSELIIIEDEEEELTVVEAFNIVNRICRDAAGCDECVLFNRCFGHREFDVQGAIDICKQWRDEHKKLQPFSDAGYADPTCEKAASLCEKYDIEQSVMIDIMKEFLG